MEQGFDINHFLAFARRQGYYVSDSNTLEEDKAVYALGDTFMSADALDELVPHVEVDNGLDYLVAAEATITSECAATTPAVADEVAEPAPLCPFGYDLQGAVLAQPTPCFRTKDDCSEHLPPTPPDSWDGREEVATYVYGVLANTALAPTDQPGSGRCRHAVQMEDGGAVELHAFSYDGTEGSVHIRLINNNDGLPRVITGVATERDLPQLVTAVATGLSRAVPGGWVRWREVAAVSVSTAADSYANKNSLVCVSEVGVDGECSESVCLVSRLPASMARALYHGDTLTSSHVLVEMDNDAEYVEVEPDLGMFSRLATSASRYVMCDSTLSARPLTVANGRAFAGEDGRAVGTVLLGEGHETIAVKSVSVATAVLRSMISCMGREAHLHHGLWKTTITTPGRVLELVPASTAVPEGAYVLSESERKGMPERLRTIGPLGVLTDMSNLSCRLSRLDRQPTAKCVLRMGLGDGADGRRQLVMFGDNGKAVTVNAKWGKPGMAPWVPLVAGTCRRTALVWYGDRGRRAAGECGALISFRRVSHARGELLSHLQGSSIMPSINLVDKRAPPFAYVVMPPGTGKSYAARYGLRVREADDLCSARETVELERLRAEARRTGDWVAHNKRWCTAMLAAIVPGDLVLVPDDDIGRMMGGSRLATLVLAQDVWAGNLRARGEGVEQYSECYNRAASVATPYASNRELQTELRTISNAWRRGMEHYCMNTIADAVRLGVVTDRGYDATVRLVGMGPTV